jgi:hypothetical protein
MRGGCQSLFPSTKNGKGSTLGFLAGCMASACRRTQVRSESGLIEDRAIVTAIILMALVNIGGTALLYVEFPRSVPKKMALGLLVSDDIELSRLTNRPEMKSCWNVSPNCCSRKSFSCRELEMAMQLSETTRSYCGPFHPSFRSSTTQDSVPNTLRICFTLQPPAHKSSSSIIGPSHNFTPLLSNFPE